MKKLKSFATSVTLIDRDGNYITTFGPTIEAESFEHAEEILIERKLTYCTLRYEIEFEDREYWDNQISVQDELSMKAYSAQTQILA